MKNLRKVFALLIIVLFFVSSFGFTAGKAAAAKKGKRSVQMNVQTKIVNINTAGVNELVTLPRIGKKIAERIIKFRKMNGKFKRIEDLMKVRGIGEKTFEKIKKRLRV